MATGSLTTGRYRHTATLLPNGKVLVVGGSGTIGFLSSAELYDWKTGVWTATGSLTTGREAQTATLLPSGKVLIVGGWHDTILSSTELYDPATGTWAGGATLMQPRDWHTATVLANGRVLVIGGGGGLSSYLYTTEVYDSGLGFNASWQPQIATATSPLSPGSSLVISGSQLRGISEGSSGNGSQDSSADSPLVQLRRLDNEQTTFVLSTNWSTNSVTSVPLVGFPAGHALATVFVNGVPSTSSIVNVSVPVATPPRLTSAQVLTNGSFQFAFTNSVNAFFSVVAATNPGLPLSNWTSLTGLAEVTPGQFQFTDPQAANIPQRFYRVRSP
jgi:hypothetical protein